MTKLTTKQPYTVHADSILAQEQTVTVYTTEGVHVPAATPSDPTSAQIMGVIEQSGVLEFWNRPEEDIYSDEDGESI